MISPFSSIRELSKALRNKRVSSFELTEMYLQRLKTLGQEHNAVAQLMEERALAEAKKADNAPAQTLLHGIPFAVKDLIAAKGAPTRWGSDGHANQTFDYDATVLARLNQAGGVLLAKTEMIALAGGGNYNQADSSRMGPCLSAWDRTLWAGGSSSGSGATTALGCVAYSLGSETSGSIVCPSAFNGCTGFRPTYGRVSRFGAMPLCWSLDKIGPIARSAEDAGIVLQAIAGHDRKDHTSVDVPLNLRAGGKKPRIGLLKETFTECKAKVAEDAYHFVLDTLRKLGYETVEVSILDGPYETATGIIVDAEGASAHEHFIRSERLSLLHDPAQIAGLVAAMKTKAVDYLWAMRFRSEALKANEVWDHCDCIFTPVFYHKSVPVNQTFDKTWINMGDKSDPSNLLGWPAIAFPIGFEDGAPIAGQVIAPAFGEDVCYRVALDFQRHSDIHLKRPPGA